MAEPSEERVGKLSARCEGFSLQAGGYRRAASPSPEHASASHPVDRSAPSRHRLLGGAHGRSPSLLAGTRAKSAQVRNMLLNLQDIEIG